PVRSRERGDDRAAALDNARGALRWSRSAGRLSRDRGRVLLGLSSLLELAEDIEAHLPPFPSTTRADLPDCVLVDNGMPYPPLSGAHRLRFEAAVLDARIGAVRRRFGELGRDQFTWWIGPSATPADLEARLRA